MKRILVGSLLALGLLMTAPVGAAAGLSDGVKPCRPTAAMHVAQRLERQEALGHDRRCARMERHLAMLQAACEAPAPRDP